ncbi:hypothetical protein P170DRAFT_450016 [Aspergillus steynii IBT 23096]|uniref:Tat pathway signal sequence n=1 Tax=Aspergillus steynii IBT 23096 TaxID=1392250 RepID=A0A2I2FWH2_9EURO|nr:uncharacterized protein P170DRAFT_450016 [Aspergillus steynii IBT 23096]PLB44957.1 hypothetical protein P170DRAFT_450016 [Aspergillus steynii IBT 23096]
MPHFKEDYLPVRHDSDSIGEVPSCDTEALLLQSKERYRRWKYTLQILTGICVALYIILLFGIFFLFKNPQVVITDQRCARQLSITGPGLDSVEYETIMFKGAQEGDNPYKGHPGPDLDAAWSQLTEVRHVSVSPEIMVSINKSNNNAVQLADGTYFGATEVFHQLHCLNLIRQHSYKEYYDVDGRRPPGLTDSSATLRKHLDHCIDILRQNIMCNGDTSVITHNWVQGYEFPYPNFNTKHKCRRFEKIVEWEKDHQVC